ncbi:MAG: outer membrane protein assembly factor BamD [Gammaproteobacteria bacterium]|nr:outer membrane protein assembly factor BamD [Gammaproteobacteria bacterium]
MRFTLLWIAVLALLLVLGGCASTPGVSGGDNAAEEKLYTAAHEALQAGDYQLAIQHLEELDVKYPFGSHALQAQLDIAYSYYKNDEPESALATANRFIKMNPRHKNVDYAYYLRGLATFKQTSGTLDRLLKRDPALRNSRAAEEALQYFAELVSRFPDSAYAGDARQRMIYLRDYLARYELNVARYYMRRGAFVAAAGRGRHILEEFDQTSVVPDTLQLLADAYTRLGLTDLAADTQRVIELNKTPAL